MDKKKKKGTNFKDRVTTNFNLQLKAFDYSENIWPEWFVFIKGNVWGQEEAHTEELPTKAT